MSGTFTQPTAPTQGLQRYNLERGVKQLYPTLWLGQRYATRLARRKAASGGDQRGQPMRPSLHKGQTMDVIDSLVGTLAKSVSGIVAQGGDVSGQLEQSFSEFTGALRTEIDGVLVKRAPAVEKPLFKGLPQISRLASLLSMVTNQAELLESGKEWSGQDDDKAKDPAGDHVMALVEAAVHAIELALSVAVNEHVDLPTDDELANPPAGMVFLHVPDPMDESEDAGTIVKMAPNHVLPEALHPFVMDPLGIEMRCIELGADMLVRGGVPEQNLAKLFDEGTLRKAAGDDDTGAQPPDDMPDMDPGDEQMDPLDLIGRLAAAIIITIDHLHGADDASGDGGGYGDDGGLGQLDDPNADQGGAGPANNGDVTQGADDGAGGAAPPFGNRKKGMGKVAPDGDLAKAVANHPDVVAMRGDMSKLTQSVAGLTDLLAKVSRNLAPAHGVLAAPLAKQADATGAATETPTAEAERLAKMAPKDRALEMIKVAYQHGAPVE